MPCNDRSPVQPRGCLPVQCDHLCVPLPTLSSDTQCSSHTKVHYGFKMILTLFLPLLEEPGSGLESFMGPLTSEAQPEGIIRCHLAGPMLAAALSKPAFGTPSPLQSLEGESVQGSLPPQSDS